MPKIAITHNTDSGELLLRMEMLAGTTQKGRQIKCRELDDKLGVHGSYT